MVEVPLKRQLDTSGTRLMNRALHSVFALQELSLFDRCVRVGVSFRSTKDTSSRYHYFRE